MRGGTTGGAEGMEMAVGGMNGEAHATTGDRVEWHVIVGTVGFITLSVAVVTSLSRVDEIDRAGLSVAPWEPWVWELTSAAFWIAVAVPLVAAARRLRPPASPWFVTILGLVAISIPVCALHLIWLAGSRGVIYSALGSSYRFNWAVIYEWRKDLLSVFIFAAIAYALDYWAAQRADDRRPTPAATPYRLAVRDGARTHWLTPGEIERVEAAGNYVELFGPEGPILHRATLSSLENELAPRGFVRIHRSRLIRRDAVRTIAVTASGDFEAILASGVKVSGSRRFRGSLA